MNKREKEVIQAQLDAEKIVLKKLETQYQRALNDINQKVKLFDADIKSLDVLLNIDGLDDTRKATLESMKQAKIYQKQYQQALKKQVAGILDKLHGDTYATVEQYLKKCYEEGYLGTMYDIQGQGVPIVVPIDQEAMTQAVVLDSKVVEGYYNALGVDFDRLKKVIPAEISRGIASSLLYIDIARNINNASKSGLYNAYRIARTEGHRIQQSATHDAQKAAKAKGADVVKQWNSTLDGRTRPTHRKLDGQIREVDEPFEVSGKKAMMPGGFGRPEEDINCRCVSLTRARWALDDDELATLKERAAFFELDKTKDFEDFKRKYLKAVEETKTVFDSATTIKELNAMTKQAFSEQGIDADFGGMDLEVAKRQADILLKLSKEYDTQLVSISTTGASKYLGNVERKGNTYSELTKARMQISKKYGKNETTWNAEIEKAVSSGNAPNIPAINYAAYTVVHEFAHSMNNDYITTFYGFGNEDFWREVAKVKDEYKEAYLRDKSISLGKYATTNNDEFVAECFAEALLSENPSEYAVRTKKLIDKYFKRKK